ncbi:MAG: hypothetical protein WAV41_01865 [Microgenomates group bacterium]
MKLYYFPKTDLLVDTVENAEQHRGGNIVKLSSGEVKVLLARIEERAYGEKAYEHMERRKPDISDGSRRVLETRVRSKTGEELMPKRN